MLSLLTYRRERFVVWKILPFLYVCTLYWKHLPKYSLALHFSEDELGIAVVIGVESANRSNMCIEVLWSLTRYIHA